MHSSSPVSTYHDDPARGVPVRSLRVLRAQQARKRRRRQLMLRLLLVPALCLVAAAVGLAVTAALTGAGRPEAPAARAPQDAPAADGAPLGVARIDSSALDERIVVYIDPGHGGADVGATGLINEHEMTWQTAQALMELLQADARFAPALTKTPEDTYKPSERAAIAREGGAQLVLSIHGNSDPVYATSYGFECYPVPPGLAFHEESAAFAKAITEGFEAAGARLRGLDGIRYLYYDANDQKVIYESNDTTVRSQPTFTLLEDAGCPAVLAEQCFITNSGDVAAFGSDEGCKVSAGIYYRAICAFFGFTPLQA